MTNKELEKRIKELEAKVEKLTIPVIEGKMPTVEELLEIVKNSKQLTIKDIEVGGKFTYKGHNYTKLNEDNFCIIDDYDEDFMRCIFDPITNNYDESIIRSYLNSERFINRLGVDLEDFDNVYTDANGKEDKLTLLSREEYEEYRDFIEDYDIWWATRSTHSSNANYFCNITSNGNINNSGVSNSSGVRLGFRLLPATPVDRKGNEE